MTATYLETLSAGQTFWRNLAEIPNSDRFRMCIQCGTCSGICPFGKWLEYTPRKTLAALRMDEFEEVLQSNSIWMCVACAACTAACPQQIPTLDLMTRLKEELLLTGNVPAELQLALENSRRYGNPMGESPKKRADWTTRLDTPVPILGKDARSVDVLWYVGDFASYHPEGQSAARAMVKVFQALGVDFGILGPDEVSDGDSQRLAGERGLFEWLAIRNGAQFTRRHFNLIVTTDPHAYNAIKNQYPALDICYPVQHYTEFLYERLDQLQPLLTHEIEAAVAYHDPCYLGRVNHIYEQPRALLKAIPGVRLIELSHQRDNSLCCGGGGGGMWLDGFQWEKAHSRLSEWRIRETVAIKPLEDFLSVVRTLMTKPKSNGKSSLPDTTILAVACPYEKPRFSDAAKVIAPDKGIQVLDIAELLAKAIA